MKSANLLDAFYGICEAQGAINPVSRDYYEEFLGLSDRQMKAMVRCIVKDRVKEINNVLKSSRTHRMDAVTKIVSDCLYLIAKGIMMFGESGKLVLLKPVGDSPDIFMKGQLEDKVASFKPIIKDVLMEMI